MKTNFIKTATSKVLKHAKEQKAIIAIVNNMNKKYAEIAGSLKTINNAINESVGKTVSGVY